MINKIKYIFILIVISLLVSSCRYRGTHDEEKIVKYEITGTAHRVNIIMVNGRGETEQFDHIKIPWERNIYPKSGVLYLSVQNQKEYGSVTARIWVNGKIIKETTTSGAYVISTVSGTLQ
jgi:hypothetical protein